ncbi:MAG: type II toxin-antitoxin system RelE/ParE family toxin [Parvibaculum sp.]
MAWTIEYTGEARNQLRKLDKQSARRILDYMDDRIAGAANPRSFGKPLTGPLGQFWRYRVGDFRIICDIEDEVLRVLVVRIGDRKDVYRKAKR